MPAACCGALQALLDWLVTATNLRHELPCPQQALGDALRCSDRISLSCSARWHTVRLPARQHCLASLRRSRLSVSACLQTGCVQSQSGLHAAVASDLYHETGIRQRHAQRVYLDVGLLECSLQILVLCLVSFQQLGKP
jgi:hypothetical protein